MKKICFLLLITISSTVLLYAQPDNKKGARNEAKQKIKSLYTAFITQELNLTQEESAKFWAIHNEFDAEMKACNHKQLPELEREEATLDIKKKYNKKFATVIGPDRTNQFFKKDGEFRHKLLDKLKEKKQKRNGQQNDMKQP